MKDSIRRFLALRGVHYLASRYGWKKLRALSFDGKYRAGDWVFSDENPDLVHLVEEYAREGHILVLGCGTAPIASALDANAFQSFLGVDLSEEAIAMANKRATAKIRFQGGDMENYQCARQFNVIVFPDSFNYVSLSSQKDVLQKLCRSLLPQGRIIVSISQPARYAGILDMIRGNFRVEVDKSLQSAGHVLVFGPTSSDRQDLLT
jgi:trans-aconitate methyltransferase